MIDPLKWFASLGNNHNGCHFWRYFDGISSILGCGGYSAIADGEGEFTRRAVSSCRKLEISPEPLT